MNKYLLIGFPATIGWVLLALIGPWYLPEPVTNENIILQINGQTNVAPIGPTEEYWFGLDKRGRNQLSLMLVGLKFTLLTVAIIGIMRQVLGSAIGIMIGMWKKPKSPIIQKGSSTFGFLGLFPAFLLAYYSLKGFIGADGQDLTPYIWTIFFIQVLVLSFFGIAPIAARAQIQTYQICSQPYVEASKMLGSSRFWIFRRHIFPSFRDTFWLNCLSEMLLVLQLVGQLSLFYLFIGGTKFIRPNEFLSMSFEWLGLIGQNRDWFIIKPETVIVPVVSYLLLSTTLFFFQKGLEVRLKEKEQQMYGSPR